VRSDGPANRLRERSSIQPSPSLWLCLGSLGQRQMGRPAEVTGSSSNTGTATNKVSKALEATPPLVLKSIPAEYTELYEHRGVEQEEPSKPSLSVSMPSIPRLVGPMFSQWNLNVQHELPQHVVASIAYVWKQGDASRPSPRLKPASPLYRGEPVQPGRIHRSDLEQPQYGLH